MRLYSTRWHYCYYLNEHIASSIYQPFKYSINPMPDIQARPHSHIIDLLSIIYKGHKILMCDLYWCMKSKNGATVMLKDDHFTTKEKGIDQSDSDLSTTEG